MTHSIKLVQKRDESIVPFELDKIAEAVYKAMQATHQGTHRDACNIAESVVSELEAIKKKDSRYIPSIEGIQNLVEEALMASSFHQAAKAYILYRNEQALKRKKNIFEKRINLKPYEYPDLLGYVDAIRHSYWVHTEFNFTADIQDYKHRLSHAERNAIQRTMLAISQIEVAVKTFWGNIFHHMPKPEIGSVGSTFAESEVRHSDAYSHLLEILGLNEEFENLKNIPVIMNRVKYLENALKNARSDNNQEYAESILLFALFIEHVSLFSQFLIIMAFNKYKNVLKGISNVVEATSKEEQIHGNFGVEIINIIRDENPSWFDANHNERVKALCEQAYAAECDIIDWIFEEGELDFLSKDYIKAFTQDRFNNSLASIGIEPIFNPNEKALEEVQWFTDEIIATKHVDFFHKRSINYNKRSQSFNPEDLF